MDKDANEDIAVQLQLDRTGLSPLVKIRFQEVLCKGSAGRTQGRRRGSSVCGPSLVGHVVQGPHKQCCQALTQNLGPINHKESYLAGAFFLLVNDPKRETPHSGAAPAHCPSLTPRPLICFLSLWICLLQTLGADGIMQPMSFVSCLFH